MNLIILPIEISSAEKLRAVYCESDKSPVELRIDHNQDASHFSTIRRMYAELGVQDLDQAKIFKLGKIDSAMCYAVDITGVEHSHNLSRVSFHNLMEGDHSNSKLLAACFLAISYFA